MLRSPMTKGLVIVCLVASTLVQGGPSQAQATLSALASGLDNPRGLAFGPDGALYIAEAGRGGNGPCITVNDGRLVCLGSSGKISRLWRGEREDVVTGLPSLAPSDGSRAIGPFDVSFQGRGNGYAVLGLGSDPDKRALLGDDGALLGQVIRFTPDGKTSVVADAAALEEEFNPHTVAVDSNPYAVVAGAHGLAYVDAGGNDAWHVATNGTASLLALFEDRPFGMLSMQAVPNAITIGPDGAYYIGQLTGVPFPAGAANVYRVVPGDDPTIYASGFTNIIDVAFGPDGSLFVLEHDANRLPVPGNDSAIHRIWPSGARTTVPTPGLVLATGLAVDRAGALYVSKNGTLAGAGEIVKIEP